MKSWIVIYILIAFVLGSCAIQSTPNGGPEDRLSPIVLEEIPENNKIWFDANQITIRLDEFVTLKNPNQELIISPPLEKNPEAKLKGKTITVSFDSDFQDSTTYTLQFGNSIADITEGNILKDYQFVFSTGAVIDSLSMTGAVVDAYTDEAVEDVKVLLYEASNDSGVFKDKPRYFARTNKTGEYRFQNLKAGKYLLFAVEDQNRDYFYNRGEQSAFYPEPIVLQSDTHGFRLRLFANQEEALKLFSAQGIAPGKSIIVYNKAITTAEVLIKDSLQSNSFLHSFSTGRDSLFFWIANENVDTSVFFISAESNPIDTVIIKYKSKKESLLTSAGIGKRDDYYGISRQISIQSSEPLIEIDTSRIVVYEDTVVVSEKFSYSRNIENPLLINVSNDFVVGKMYRFYIQKNALTGISGRKNDSILMNFMIRDIIDLGSITIKVDGKEISKGENIIIELLNSRSKTRRVEIMKGGVEKDIVFSELIPDKYSFRIVVDSNNNGRWDSGNIETQTQPESVYYLKQKIELKANWEILDVMYTIPTN